MKMPPPGILWGSSDTTEQRRERAVKLISLCASQQRQHVNPRRGCGGQTCKRGAHQAVEQHDQQGEEQEALRTLGSAQPRPHRRVQGWAIQPIGL